MHNLFFFTHFFSSTHSAPQDRFSIIKIIPLWPDNASTQCSYSWLLSFRSPASHHQFNSLYPYCTPLLHPFPYEHCRIFFLGLLFFFITLMGLEYSLYALVPLPAPTAITLSWPIRALLRPLTACTHESHSLNVHKYGVVPKPQDHPHTAVKGTHSI